MALKYPLGIQTFKRLVKEGFIYVDKTEMVYNLAHSGTYFFLSRPRRFGKSLLLSTIDAYFSGQKELFKGLAIDTLETEWESYPVLRIDLNAGDYTVDVSNLINKLDGIMLNYEEAFNIPKQGDTVGDRFGNLIRNIFNKTGKQVVILVDEYDKPLIANIERDKWDLQEKMRNTLKSFYGNVKTMDPYIKFAFFTGVSRFSHVSIFSDINNLTDISLDARFSAICGISEEELHHYCDEGVAELADYCQMTKDEAYTELKHMYDGFCFSAHGKAMYNPWSIFMALNRREFDSYWYATGTPTFLIKLIREKRIDLTQLDSHIDADSSTMMSNDDNDNLLAVLYQSGYLTIKGYDAKARTYTLGIPNGEVMQAFSANLLPYYSHLDRPQAGSLRAKIFRAAQAGNVDTLLTTLKGILAEAPVESNDERIIELNYRNIVAIALRMSGLDVHIEQPTSASRIDLALEADDYVYIMEFKRTTLEAAALQLESRHYADSYLNDSRKVMKIAIALDDSIKNISSWQVLE